MVEQIEAVQRRSTTEVRVAQVGLVVAAIGAVVVVFDAFGLGVLGLVLGAVGAAMAFPYGAGERWYVWVAGGAILAILAKLVAGPHQTIGGWLAVIAALAILAGASLGFPGEEE
ncbi:MAG: hypothetical protein WDZ37_03025 [Solirubrobacterales bacterium]